MKIESKLDIFAGVFLVISSLWLFSDRTHILTRGQLLAPVFLGIYFIFEGIFGFVHRRAKSSSKKTRNTEISLNGKNMLSMEEIYYYKGKTNQQLQHYSEALQCYTKSLELNPNFEPAKNAKKEVKKIILGGN